MAEGTCAVKLSEGLEEVKQKQEAQRLQLEELMQQLENLTVGLRAVVQTLDQNRGETPPPRQHHNNHNQEIEGVQMRSVRLDFPRFDREDPTCWLHRANQFFYLQSK